MPASFFKVGGILTELTTKIMPATAKTKAHCAA
jgi:hypothetical protein